MLKGYQRNKIVLEYDSIQKVALIPNFYYSLDCKEPLLAKGDTQSMNHFPSLND
jgi:hypothetical protein